MASSAVSFYVNNFSLTLNEILICHIMVALFRLWQQKAGQ